MNQIVLGILIAFFFIGLILFFCVILIRLYFTKIKKYSQLLFQKDLDFQKTLTTTVIETQEQVLNNISQDLHDDAGQQLTYINFQLENLKLDSPELKDTLAPLSQSVGQLGQSIRSISHALNHQLLLQQDLLKAIATEMERLQKNSKIAFTVVIPQAGDTDFSANEKIIIYRIFQECINNAMKHSRATAIAVTIKLQAHFVMVISDNGQGFDIQAPKQKQSLGLANLKARAESIAYSINIASKIGEGTTITLSATKTV